MRNVNENPFSVMVATGDLPYGMLLQRQLEIDGYDIERCGDAKGVLRLVGRHVFDVIVLDIDLDDQSDVELVSFIRRQSPSSQLILLFDILKVERAIEGIRRGAFFYLPKSAPPADVALVVDKAVDGLTTRARIDEFDQAVFEQLVGSTQAMQRVVELITKVAPTDSTVLLLGESGTGKEVFANAIHRLSTRRENPFIAINCAALPEGLLESEMFGHVKGAFTGASSDKRGLFEEADNGTLFLDEIGDMSLITQAKLLRVLQNGEIRQVGSSQLRSVNVRVVAATNMNLVEAVAARRFREDLYFRLNVIQIHIPPLRERMDSLPAFVAHFIRQYGAKYGKTIEGFEEAAEVLMRHYDYPGNVRELESIIAHAIIMSDEAIIRARDLPDQVRYGHGMRLALPNYARDNIPTIEEMEADLIRNALRRLDDNQTETAKRLGISRSTLWRKMKQYGIFLDERSVSGSGT